MADIIITPLAGKIDFFTNKGDNTPINGVKLVGSNLVFYGPISASSILTNGGGRYVTTTSPTVNYVPKFNSNSSIANSLIFDTGTNVGIGTTKPSASLHIISSTSGATLLRADGTNGSIFSVIDDLTDSLMSVNNSAGLPVLEVFADDRVVAGQYNTNDFVIVNNKVGIGTNNPVGKLHVTGSSTTPAATFIGNVGIGTTSFVYSNANRGDIEVYGSTDALISLRNATANSYIHKTGNDFYINNGGAGNLIFQNNSSERARIDSNGNIGIGTSNPAARLNIVDNNQSPSTGNLLVQSTGGNASIRVDSNSTSNYTYFTLSQGGTGKFELGIVPTTSDLYINSNVQVGSTNASIYIKKADGNVGIGTTSPSGVLQVVGTGAGAVGTINIKGSQAHLGLTNAAGTFKGWYGYFNSADHGSDLDLNIKTGYNSIKSNIRLSAIGDTTQVFISGSGYVGIGTTTPNKQLTFTQVDDDPIQIRRRTVSQGGPSSGTGISWTWTSATTDNETWAAIRAIFPGNGDSHLTFSNRPPSGATTERMRIQNDGNVGIGTTAPAYKLDVNGILGISGTFFADKSTNYFRILEPAGNVALYLGNASDPTNYYDNTGHTFRNRGGSSVYAYINSNGNLGIGTTSPGAPLTIYRSSNPWIRVTGGGAFSYIQLDDGTSYGYLLKNSSSDTSNNALAGALYTYTDSGKAFQHISSGVPLFTILSGGSVGIGTTAPSATLDVNGNIKFGSGTTSVTRVTGSLHVTGSITLNANRDSNWPFLISDPSTTGGSSRYALNKTGAMGFNHADSYAQLQLVGANGAYIDLCNSSTDDLDARIFYVSNTRLDLMYGTTVSINSTGVGIGSSSPIAKLDINGTSNFAPNVYHSIGGQKFFAGSGGAYNYIYTGTTTLNFINGSDTSTIMSLLNNGNLGIGTTTPAYKFHIYSGSMYVQGGAGASVAKNYTSFSRLIFDTDHSDTARGPNKITLYDSGGWVGGIGVSSNVVGYYSGGNHIWHKSTSQTAFTEYMRLDSNGNLGIGTSSPTSKLFVSAGTLASNQRAAYISADITTNTTVYTHTLNLIDSSADANTTSLALGTYSHVVFRNRAVTAGSAGGILDIYTRGVSTDPTVKMTITDVGNVGIGSTIPAYKLDLYDTNQDVARFYNNQATFGLTLGSASNTSYTNLIWTTSTGNAQFFKNRSSTSWGGADYFNFYTSNGGFAFHPAGTTNAVYFASNGNVGIGTTTTPQKLNVNGTIFMSGGNGTAISWASDISSQYLKYDSGIDGMILNSYNATAFYNNGAERMRILSNGNVGIGLTNPSYKLQVNGDIYASGPMYSPYLSTIAGTYNDLNAPDIALNSMYKGDAHNYDIFQFNAPNTYETQATSGGAWTSAAVNQDIFLGDTTGPSTLTIPNGTFAVRFTWNSIGYRFFNCLYIMNSTQGNYYTVTIEHSANGTTWTTVGTTGAFTGWPGHSRYINYWNNSTTQAYLRLTLTPTWQNANNIFIYIMRYFCSYYLNGAIRLYTWDYSRKVTFPTYLTVAGTDNNSNKADFSVDTGGTATMALSSQYFRVGSTDVNWAMKIQSNGYIATYAQQLDIATTAGAYVMTFATNGTERMRIDGSSGNIGVGFTTVPVHKLQASGLVSASDPTYNNDSTFIGAILNNDGTNPGLDLRRWNGGAAGTNNHGATYIATNSVGDTIFYNGLIAANTRATSEKMRIAVNGNVGIGTTSPAALLNIRASTPTGTTSAIAGTNIQIDSNTSNYISFINTADNGTYAGLVFTDNNNGGYIVFRNYTGDVNAGSDCLIYGTYQDHIFQTGTTAGVNSRNEVVRIKNNGNVGIGSTSPNDKLDVAGRVYAYRYIAVSSNASLPAYATDTSTGMFNAATNQIGFTINGTEKLRINTDGNLGIGTTSVSYKLDVVGGVRATTDNAFGFVLNRSATNVWTGIGFFTNNTNKWFYGMREVSDDNLRWYNYTNASERMVLTETGNLGIGTTSTSARLHLYSSTSGATLVRTDGTNGVLFSVVDDLTDSLMSVNNSAGLPVFEVFADDRVIAGQYNANDFVVVNNKVGIGTNIPVAKLHVTASTSLPAAAFLGDVGIGTTSPTSQANYRFLQVNGPVSAIIETTVGGSRIGGFDSTSNTLYVGTIGSYPVVFRTAVNEKMRIAADGNVGIGTTSPSWLLTAYATSAPQFVLQNATRSFILTNNSGDNLLSFYYNSANRLQFNLTDQWFNSGNVGIGSTSPGAKLDVAGSIKVSAKLIQNSATVSVSGTGQTLTLNLDTAAVYVVSMASGATITTISYTNRDNNPSVNTIMLVVKYAGTASITFTNVIWANGVAPTLTGTNGYADVFMLTSYQGGAGTPVWIGTVVAQALVSTNL